MKKFPIQYNAPVTISFSLLALAALLINLATGGAANKLVFSVYRCSLRDVLAMVFFAAQAHREPASIYWMLIAAHSAAPTAAVPVPDTDRVTVPR